MNSDTVVNYMLLSSILSLVEFHPYWTKYVHTELNSTAEVKYKTFVRGRKH